MLHETGFWSEFSNKQLSMHIITTTSVLCLRLAKKEKKPIVFKEDDSHSVTKIIPEITTELKHQ